MDRLETVGDELAAARGIPRVFSEDRASYTLSCDPERLQPERVHACLTEIYWSKGIDLATVARLLRHSFCVGVYAGGTQVALTRVITDFTTFAWLTDVYVEKEHQGRGLASWMVDFILRHPDLQSLRRFLLASRDARDLYRRFGFTEPRHPERIMELFPRQPVP
jgi:GNAT superfamily N-acetyltransferase